MKKSSLELEFAHQPLSSALLSMEWQSVEVSDAYNLLISETKKSVEELIVLTKKLVLMPEIESRF